MHSNTSHTSILVPFHRSRYKRAAFWCASVGALVWLTVAIIRSDAEGESRRLRGELGKLSTALDEQAERVAELSRHQRRSMPSVPALTQSSHAPRTEPEPMEHTGRDEAVEASADPERIDDPVDLDETARLERDLETHQQLADDLDARRYAGTADAPTYRTVGTRLMEARLHLLESTAEDGCSDDICAFSLGSDANLSEALSIAEPVLAEQGFAHIAVMQLPAGKVRMYVTRRGVPLKRRAHATEVD